MKEKTEISRQHVERTNYSIVKYREVESSGDLNSVREIEIREYDHDAITAKMIGDAFVYHPPVSNQVPRYEQLRAKAKELAELYAKFVPPGRERSAALTELQKSIMLANAGIACGEK